MSDLSTHLSMPSSEENLKLRCEESPAMSEHVGIVLNENSMRVVIEDDCVFKRGGWCTTHSVAGRRIIKNGRVWKPKKDGTYGYVSQKKVSYICEKVDMNFPPTNQLSDGIYTLKPESNTAQKMGEGDHYEGKVRHTKLLLSDNQGLVDGITRDGANMET